MERVTIPKIEYNRLKRESRVYRHFAAHFFQAAIGDPIDAVIKDFRNTAIYSGEFLQDLEDGLRKSSYSKVYESKAATQRSHKRS